MGAKVSKEEIKHELQELQNEYEKLKKEEDLYHQKMHKLDKFCKLQAYQEYIYVIHEIDHYKDELYEREKKKEKVEEMIRHTEALKKKAPIDLMIGGQMKKLTKDEIEQMNRDAKKLKAKLTDEILGFKEVIDREEKRKKKLENIKVSGLTFKEIQKKYSKLHQELLRIPKIKKMRKERLKELEEKLKKA